MRLQTLMIFLALGIVFPCVGEGFFGISGGLAPGQLPCLAELGVDAAIYGFFIGPAGPPEARPRDRRLMRGLLELGITPVPTFWTPRLDEEVTRSVAAIVEYFTCGPGAEELGGTIRYGQIGNEENGGWGTSCPPEEFARRVAVIAAGIRGACPNCTVVMGGLLDGPEMGDWALEPYLTRFLAAGGGEWIDVYNFHYYGLARPHPRLPLAQAYRSGEEIVGVIRRVLREFGYRGKPIWCTETSTYSGQVGEIFQSEEEQAADLVKRFVLLYALGVEKAFWTYLVEPRYEGTGEGFFDQAGLIYDGYGTYDRGAGVEKLAFYAYRELSRRLRGAELVARWEREGVSWFSFRGRAGAFSVLWQDPWVRGGPVWITPAGTLRAVDLYGQPLGEWGNTFALELGLAPLYLLGEVEGISLSAPTLVAP